MKIRHCLLLATLALTCSRAHAQQCATRPCVAADASTPGPGESDVLVGSYNVTVGGTQLRAAVYRPPFGGLNAPAPLVVIMHGNHGTCGRIYNPGAAGAAALPQATYTFRNLAGTVVAVRPVPVIANPGVAETFTIDWRNGAGVKIGTITYRAIVANTLDPGGLPCTRPVGGGPCTQGIRLDFWNYSAAPRVCPAGASEAPSYLGYAYLGRRLASQGYVVVSIDANLINNRGNGGPGGDRQLIQARGTLVLQHLVQLSAWTRNGGAPAGSFIRKGTLDLGNVALVGHSRGGEAMRAAYHMYTAAGSPWPARIVTAVSFDGIFEIGPTDFLGQNASGVTWNVLLPMCDADVTDLSGVRPFDREMLDFTEVSLNPGNPSNQKSTYTVWGANHNFYNTQWMVSDTYESRQTGGAGATATFAFRQRYPCTGGDAGNLPLFPGGPGSPRQRLTALSSVPALVRGNVGNANVPTNPAFNQNFNTLFALPPNVSNESGGLSVYPTRTDRGYSPTARPYNAAAMTGQIAVMEDFNQATGTNTSGQPNVVVGITMRHVNGSGGLAAPPAPPAAIPNHDRTQRVGYIQWPAASAGPYFFQANWTAAGKPGKNITGYQTLDFRVSRNHDTTNNATPTTNFSIQIVGANGVLTRAVQLSSYTPVANDLRGPVDGGKLANPDHPILQTYRIPLTDFGNFNFIAPQVRGVRFTFDQTASGAIFLGNVRFVHTLGVGVNNYPPALSAMDDGTPPGPEESLLATSETPEAEGIEGEGGGDGSPATPVGNACELAGAEHFSSLPALGGAPGWEFEFLSPFSFLNNNEMLVMGATDASGTQTFTLSYYPGADANGLIFALTDSQYQGLSPGSDLTIQYGIGPAAEYWACGTLQ